MSPADYNSEKRDVLVEQTRQRIIDAAVQLLADGKSGADFTLEAVAVRAAVTRKTVYNHFDSRAGLAEAIFDRTGREGGLTQLPAAFANPDPIAGLTTIVQVFCRFWALHQGVMPRLAATIAADRELSERLAARAERRRQGLAMLVGRLGGVPDDGLVDLLFTVTAMPFFEALKHGGRSDAEIEALVLRTVMTLVGGLIHR